MQNYENYGGAKHRILILMYITLFTLSLAPAMVAPPKKGFVQGQPEMQLAMDNMVNHKTLLKKRLATPSEDGSEQQDVLNFKTSNLIAEAEQVLKNLPDSKERQWIQSFVQRIKEIGTMLGKIAQNRNVSKYSNSVKGAPVPDGLPLQPTRPATSAVPGINPFQISNKIMSNFHVTSPELSQVLPDNEHNSERQAVTKPAALSSEVEIENDQLVRELESLHDEYAQENLHNSKVLDQVPISTTPSIPLFSESSPTTLLDVEAEKSKLKTKLIEEIEEFHRLGGVIPKEVIDALYTDNHNITELAYSPDVNMDDKMKFTEAGMIDRRGMQRVDDFHNEERAISKTNLQNMPYHTGQFQHLKFNHTFENRYPNFAQTFPKQIGNMFQPFSLQNKAQSYQGHLPSAFQDFQNPNLHYQRKYLPNQPTGYTPDALKQMLPKPRYFYNGHFTAPDYNNYLMKYSYGRYPYVHNWKPKNSTLDLPRMRSTNVIKPPVNHQIDTQLSDEMKRELRDGKIIVLSDSVVRSNLEPNKNENINQREHSLPQKKENNTEN